MDLMTTKRLTLGAAFTLSTGGITPLNKILPQMNAALIAAGERPKLRPVNNGANITKATIGLATRSESATRVKLELQPLQKGLGLSGGPEATALTAQALHELGWIICKEDCKNGFNAVCRQAVLTAIEDMWPEATTIFNNFYGITAPIIMTYTGDDASNRIRMIRSKEGTRMGCPGGSIGFDIAEHYYIFQHMQVEFPELVFFALTDDFITAAPPPGPDESIEDIYELIGLSRSRYDSLANPIGLERVPEKSAILVPIELGAPKVTQPTLKGVFLSISGHHLRPVFDGTTIGGAPIGTDSFRRGEATNKARNALLTLAKHEPHGHATSRDLC